MGSTPKIRDVQANGQVALVVDDVVSRDPRRVRGIEIRGTGSRWKTSILRWFS